jgi:hypothetical protein
MKYLIPRIGLQNALDVWETAFKNYDFNPINYILASGWKEIANSDPLNDEQNRVETLDVFSPFLKQNHLDQILDIIENSPPIKQIRSKFGNSTFEKEIGAYDALFLRFDGQANLAETMIKLYGKQGEFITYDIMVESRLAAVGGPNGTVKEFIEDFTSLPTGKNLFSAGLEIEVVEKSQNSASVFVHQCEWARFFRDRHPGVGYLLACSTDEVAYQAFNSNLKLQRTGTIMEGSDKCDFRVYTF